VTSVGPSANRPELTATYKRGERTHEVALLDIENIDADAATSRPIAAYHRWASTR
jgi:hypothetical protein